MDGKNRAVDNIFTERLWRSLKYEEVYLHEYASPEPHHRSCESALSDEVISKIHTIINAVLTRAHERGFVAKNVAKLVDKPRFSKKKMEVWNEKEVLQFK